MEEFLPASFWSDDPPPMSDRESLEWAARFSPRAEAELRRLQFAEAEAARELASLEWAARFSKRAEAKLRRLRQAEAATEAEAQRERASLEWAARISTRAEEKLRALQQKEPEEREARRRTEGFYDACPANVTEWSPDQPRVPAGSPQGGRWAKGGGGGASAGEPPSQPGLNTQRNRGVADRTIEPATTAGTPSPIAKTGEKSPNQDLNAPYLRDFDKGHDLNLRGAMRDGRLSADEILRIKFTDDEIKQILESARSTASGFNLSFYTGTNLPTNLRVHRKITSGFVNDGYAGGGASNPSR